MSSPNGETLFTRLFEIKITFFRKNILDENQYGRKGKTVDIIFFKSNSIFKYIRNIKIIFNQFENKRCRHRLDIGEQTSPAEK